MEEVSSNLAQIQDKIAAAAERVGRKPEDARLVAISKKKSSDHIRAALEAGQTLFGENLVQEALRKKEELPGSMEWHLVGHLQKNKVRGALETFDLIHSIDSLALAERVQRLAEEPGFRPRVLLQVNVAGEASKYGFSPDTLRTQFERLLELDRLEIEGLMTIPPLAAKPEDSRGYFIKLREYRDALQEEFQAGLPELSMGMSGDYEVAVEEGATLVRVGQAIFGERKT
jgi:hypothetical protein